MTRPAITLVTPHTRRTSGGVYVIRQFARHLAPHAKVTLVSRHRRPRALDNVHTTASPSLSPRDLPKADVLLAHADTNRFEHLSSLPRAKGTLVLLLQGVGQPDNPTVKDTVAAGRRPTAAHVARARCLP